MRQHTRHPHEVRDEERNPAGCDGNCDPRGLACQLLDLKEEKQDQAVRAKQHRRIPRLVRLPFRQRQSPGAGVHDLQDAPEAEAEEQGARHREQC